MVRNWKVITMYLIIVIVIIEIIVKMIVMVMNKDNNKQQYFKVKKQTMNQSKSACPSILNVKRPNIYTHIN